jgi:branched-chain amino acid transport system substrate-binding protein
VCQEKGIPFFGTLTYSTATTGKEALRHTFRECYNAWMAAKAMASYLKDNFAGKKYFYVTADYTWGHTTEASMREITGTEDETVHKSVRTPFPGAKLEDFGKALIEAKKANPEVLVLIEFGDDMATAVNLATKWGLKKTAQIVVPSITLYMAQSAGPDAMEGVIGALPWTWRVPYEYNYPRGKSFVENYAAKYGRYPSTSGASAYTILYEYKDAVERAQTFDSAAVIKALEGHYYQVLKDQQYWRTFDHQSVQTVYLVKGKPKSEILADKFQLDYFEIFEQHSRRTSGPHPRRVECGSKSGRQAD